MNYNIQEVAERIFALRDATGYTEEEMAEAMKMSVPEYKEYESGKKDFTFTFLYKCAEMFGVDIIELLTGENPHLSGYTLTRNGKGLPMKRKGGFKYYHLASNFKDKTAVPFLMKAAYRPEELDDVPTSMHDGQEFDYILKGKMKFVYDGHTEELHEGDSVFYNSSKKHGMTALTKDGCTFLAVVLKEERK